MRVVANTVALRERLARVRLVLFDLDGTLVDSVPDLASSADLMLQQMGRAPAGELAVKNAVGNGVERLVKRLLTGTQDAEPEQAEFERALELFRAAYAHKFCERSRLYEGVAEALQALSDGGLTLGCITNKAEAFTLPLLDALGIKPHFAVIVGGDTLAEKKPHPLPLLHAAEQCGYRPDQTLMVGDSRHDIEAARRARIFSVAVPYGYNHGEPVEQSEPDLTVQNLSELPALLQLRK